LIANIIFHSIAEIAVDKNTICNQVCLQEKEGGEETES
jgi:hypothetical protein